MIRRLGRVIFLLGISMMIASCDSRQKGGQSLFKSDGNVITDAAGEVFFKKELALDQSETNRVISVVQEFANERGMEFLLARNSLPSGDVNVSANSSDLNIKVMHTTSVGDTGFQVFAISRASPTDADRQAVLILVTRLQDRR